MESAWNQHIWPMVTATHIHGIIHSVLLLTPPRRDHNQYDSPITLGLSVCVAVSGTDTRIAEGSRVLNTKCDQLAVCD